MLLISSNWDIFDINIYSNYWAHTANMNWVLCTKQEQWAEKWNEINKLGILDKYDELLSRVYSTFINCTNGFSFFRKNSWDIKKKNQKITTKSDHVLTIAM